MEPEVLGICRMKILSRIIFTSILVMAVIVALFLNRTNSAEIVQKLGEFQGEKIGSIYLIGNIEVGDGAKFKQALEDFSVRGITTTHVSLASRGGSVTAAMEIGRIVQRYGLATSAPLRMDCCGDEFGLLVATIMCPFLPPSIGESSYDLLTGHGNPDCECTSACALIWAAGVKREGSRVGLHRPYLEKGQIKKLPFSETENAQNQLLKVVRTYLRDMNIPEMIISRMEGASSRDIYFLERDVLDRYEYDPALEEWLLAKCDGGTDAEHWKTCSFQWLIVFQKERQGIK